ncbi:MAG: DNA polymerase domain-containing protein [Candidatus Didemnitutus sp.]|nr:DNA polymerase domain-containing protein [Candidatus Didemnitutus sp.]
MPDSLCGLWIDPTGRAHVAVATPEGGRVTREEPFQPFAWAQTAVSLAGIEFTPLTGTASFGWLAHAASRAEFETYVKAQRENGPIDVLKPYESQWLLQQRARLYHELSFANLRRCQLDIETASSSAGGFSNARVADDRILAIGLQWGEHRELLVLEAETATGERELLRRFNEVFAAFDPDVVEGHNIFKFDLDYLRQRCRRHQVPCAWGRFGQEATFRHSRIKIADRLLDFPRCDLPGRAVIDTYLLVQLYDITSREMTSYGLKDAAIYFGVTPESGEGRTYIDGAGIQDEFRQDRAKFLAYLRDDLRETKGLADVLLPTYFEQARAFPLLLQDAALRGTAGKVDLLFLEEYYHARAACPLPVAIGSFEGGFTRSFQEGVFRHVLHFDVAALYPSLLLQIGRNPGSDTLGVFIPMLARLRDYRLKYKALARTADSAAERDEAQARQSAFKILINSFYGYLGFSGARFGDGELAAEVTRRGRELLQGLIAEFQRQGCTILEADTDGIYLSTEQYFSEPEKLLALVQPILPTGIELEFDGRYDAMFCYKAKNYALAVDRQITLRGSALRSRGIEPFLKRLSDTFIAHLLGVSDESPAELVRQMREQIRTRTMPVGQLAKSETLGQNPDAYAELIASGGKPRRAAAEAALQLIPRPRMGERVSYYLLPAQKGQTADWQRARPVALYDATTAPYDPVTYLRKIDDWVERYGRFAGVTPEMDQQELLF